MNIWHTAALTAALVVTPTAAAHAAQLETGSADGPGGQPSLHYVAGAHERNRLTVTIRPEFVTFDDPGARIRRASNRDPVCTFSHHRRRVRCPRYDDHAFLFDLGDRGDSLRFRGQVAPRLGATRHAVVKDASLLAENYGNSEGALPQFVHVTGGSGNDVIHTTRFGDFVDPGRGRDSIDTGGGNDLIAVATDGRRDTIRGGRGIDTVDSLAKAPVTIDLGRGTLAAGTADADALNSFERAHGGSGNDTLAGSPGGDGLAGDGGDDTVGGGPGNDFVAGDLPPQNAASDTPGVDSIRGGDGDDIVDGREFDETGTWTMTPTDRLACDAGGDTVLARQDDWVEGDCEESGSGNFEGLFFFSFVALDPASLVTPVARGGDGAPTYAIACVGSYPGSSLEHECHGRLQLERPPEAGAASGTAPELLGTGEFTIAPGARAEVAVTLTDAGRAALAQPGARGAVHVLLDSNSDPTASPPPADFGWQQVLGP